MKVFRLLTCAAMICAAQPSYTQTPTPPFSMTNVTESAVLVRPAQLKADPAFSLNATLLQILKTGGVAANAANRDALLKSLLGSLTASQQTNTASLLRMRVQPRAQEAELPPASLFAAGANQMVPIGLFNRLDLSPADRSDCGEYRIVYAMPGNSFLMIFEAKMPNATRSEAACGKLARFWQKLDVLPVDQRLSELKRFYFDGVEGFPPAIHAKHFGTQLGQVRSNFFINSPWQLREWKVAPAAAGKILFSVVPVASTPLSELYAASNASSLDPAREANERSGFQNAFVNAYAGELTDNDARQPQIPGLTFDQIAISTMGARFDPRTNEFQSDAQGQDRPAPSQAFKNRIPNFVSTNGARSVDPDQLINRAEAMTCGGCHMAAAGKPIGNNGLTWPNSNSFRHIGPESDPSGQQAVSEALSRFFIPFRRANMAAFLNRTEGAVVPSARVANPRADEASSLFDRIVTMRKGREAKAARGDLARYERAVLALHTEDVRKEGLFMRFRRPH